MGKLWWRCVYANEFFLLLPCLTWSVIRTTTAQRVVDLLRTVPLLVYIMLLATAVVAPTLADALFFAVYTLLLNLAMYAADKKRSSEYTLESTKAQLMVLATLLSPLAFVTGSPTHVAGLRPSPLRYVCIAANLVGCVYLATALLLVQPFTDAWLCYPHPRTLASLTHGYCPQLLLKLHPNETPPLRGACRFLDAWGPSARCGDEEGEYASDLHAEADWTMHVALQILTVSGTCYALMIPDVIATLKAGACIKQA